MAKFKFRKDDINPEISISPMIDMIFLLLLFFILTSTFKKETGMQVNYHH